jgi:CRP-like cAMP-binding protein
MNYCTLAVLEYPDFNSLVSTFPQCVAVFKQGMYSYNDRFKRFLLRTISRVPFFRELNWKTEQDLVYSIKHVIIEEGEYLARPGQSTEDICFLIDGALEVSITVNDKALARHRTQIYGLQAVEFSHQHTWNMSSLARSTRIKRFTEIYPLVGNTGVEGSLHATALDSEKGIQHVLGRYCVELILDVLGSGSSFGFFTMLGGEQFSIQAKAVERCSMFVLDRATVSRLRKTHPDLHENLSKHENWCRGHTPHVDDYIASNDNLPGFQYEVNAQRGLNRLRGAVIRVIKENRDLCLLQTPTLAHMMKNMTFKPSRAHRAARAADNLTKEIFRRMFNPKGGLVRKRTDLAATLRELNSKLSLQSTLLRTMSEQAGIPMSELPKLLMRRTSVAVQTEDMEEVQSQRSVPVLDEYVTVPFNP